MELDDLKRDIRQVGLKYSDREQRSKRIFLGQSPYALKDDADREFSIRDEISKNFEVPFSSVAFTGSAQIGFSIHKDHAFQPRKSDLDVACIDSTLFQKAWIDIVSRTRAFTDFTAFGHGGEHSSERLMQNFVKRGMVLIDTMPRSELCQRWKSFQYKISRTHSDLFGRISIAIYMNEYAFCWKQDSALRQIMDADNDQ